LSRQCIEQISKNVVVAVEVVVLVVEAEMVNSELKFEGSNFKYSNIVTSFGMVRKPS
jgi:hypothetical protein